MIYELYGLRVRSELPLPARIPGGSSFDVDFQLSPSRPIPNVDDGGELLASLHFSDAMGYTFTRSADGSHRLRFFSTCDFELDSNLGTVRAVPDLSCSKEMVALLFLGNVLAFVLSLRGHCLLHASALAIEGRALGLVGNSGMGKSTLAALLCAHGASLISDDLLRLEIAKEGAVCFKGPQELRLRSAASELARPFGAASQRATVDGRIAVRPNCVEASTCALHALVIPEPSRTVSGLELTRLSAAAALAELLRYPRVTGWTKADQWRDQFTVLAQLVRAVPVFAAKVPWGPPFALDLAAAISGSLGVAAG